MTAAPILGTWTEPHPLAHMPVFAGDTVTRHARGGLHYIRGNAAPYFSLTCENGADHETILRHLPHLYDVAALHLSDMDGAPMHAEANGWYWYAGALGGLGETYHGSNGRDGRSPEECARLFAKHARISPESDAAPLLAARLDRAAFRAWIETQRPRWKAEAEGCIARHGLRVFGDAWAPRSA